MRAMTWRTQALNDPYVRSMLTSTEQDTRSNRYWPA